MSKNGLLIDSDWCTGCHSCEVACQMLKGLPTDQFGIKLAEIGPWEISDGNWQYSFVPIPTKQCDLCADRTAKGQLPSCVNDSAPDWLTH